MFVLQKLARSLAGGGGFESRSLAMVRSRVNSLKYSSAPRAPKRKPGFGERARTSTDAAASARGPGPGTTTAPAAADQSGSDRAPRLVTTGTRLASPAITLPRRELTPSGYGWRRRSQARRWAATSTGDSSPVAVTRPARFRIGRGDLRRDTARDPRPMSRTRARELGPEQSDDGRLEQVGDQPPERPEVPDQRDSRVRGVAESGRQRPVPGSAAVATLQGTGSHSACRARGQNLAK